MYNVILLTDTSMKEKWPKWTTDMAKERKWSRI